MYIALEGVKGCGKSTLIKALKHYYEQNNIPIKLACPTAPGSLLNIFELVVKLLPQLRKYDLLNELIYALRSNITALKIFNNSGFVLGDRSIVTSYAYRWKKFLDREKIIKRVNTIEFLIPAPDYIIFLDIDAKEAVNRISKRKKRNYGLKDEQYDNIKEILNSYKEIINSPIARLKNTSWHIIDANKSFNDVFNECVMLINNKLEMINKEAKYEY